MRDDYDLLLWFTVGLCAFTLFLTIRYLADLDDRVESLRFEFYRKPQPVVGRGAASDA